MRHGGVLCTAVLLTMLSTNDVRVLADERPCTSASIRSASGDLRDLVRLGIERSRTFRSLVDRLTWSDLVIYLEHETNPISHVEGRLSFVGAVLGHRFVRIRLVGRRPIWSQVAMLGHELRHAIELADAPQVADEPAMARLYEEIGVERSGGRNARRFETRAAIDAGYRIYRELIVPRARVSAR